MAAIEQRYVMVGALRRTDVAATYAARLSGALELDRWVVIKLPRLEVLPTARDGHGFVAECQRLARLNHDALVPIEDTAIFTREEIEATPELDALVGGGEAPFVAYPYLPGETLTGVLEAMSARGRLMVAELAAYLAASVCDALDYAHGPQGAGSGRPDGRPLGVVHGNLGPQNVLVTYAGAVKAMDLGLERALGIDRVKFAPTVRSLGYLAPERVRGEDPSHAGDLFSLGVLMWEAVAGQPLFRGRDVPHTMQLVRDCYVPSLRELGPDIPADFAAIVGRALARDRRERYDSAYELGRDLRRFLASRGAALSAAELARIMGDLFGDRARETDPLRRLAQGVDPSRALVPTSTRPAVRRSLSLSGRPAPAPSASQVEPATEDIPTPPSDHRAERGPSRPGSTTSASTGSGRPAGGAADAWAQAAARRDGADPRGIGAGANDALGTPLPALARASMLDMQLQDPVMVALAPSGGREAVPPGRSLIVRGTSQAGAPVADPSEPDLPMVPAPPASAPDAVSRSPLPSPIETSRSPIPLGLPPEGSDRGAMSADPDQIPTSRALVALTGGPGDARTASTAEQVSASSDGGSDDVASSSSPSGSWRLGASSTKPGPAFDMADLRRPRALGEPLPSPLVPTSRPEAPRLMEGAAWSQTPQGEPLDLGSLRPWWSSPMALLGLLCMVAAAALIVVVGRRQAEPVVQPLEEIEQAQHQATSPAGAPQILVDAGSLAVAPSPEGAVPSPSVTAPPPVVSSSPSPSPVIAPSPVPTATPGPTVAATPPPTVRADAGAAAATPPTSGEDAAPAPAVATPGPADDPTEEDEGDDAINIGEDLARDGHQALLAGDLTKAEKLLDDCVQFGGPSACLRDLGAVHEKRGRSDSARAAYRAYLSAAPDASDRAAVEARIAALGP